jgi:hypothetical protein
MHAASQRAMLLLPALGFLLSPQKQAWRGTRFKVAENMNLFMMETVFKNVFVIVYFFKRGPHTQKGWDSLH